MKKILTLSMLFAATSLFAQDDTKKLSITGSVDTYYQTNLTSADDAIVDGASQSFGTSFADETGFALGMANAVLGYEGEKTGAVADLAFGPRGDAAVGGFNINQLYAYWNVSETTTLTAGRFNTYLGYEVISPTGNFNYSTSYLFSNGPFSHVGLKADFSVSDDFSIMLALMNATDVNNNTTGDYALGAQFGYKGQYLNLYYDNEEVLGFEIDYTGGFDLSDSFYLGINAAYADNDGNGFYGAALYPQYAINDAFTIGLRGEFFSELGDNDLFAENSEDDSVFATTLTGSYTIENLTIKPELRIDTNSEDVFLNNDSTPEPTNSFATFLVGAIYAF